ncbi:MAG: ABC transporter permease [Xanthomonadales bacterium]|nr:ABC transporter permease [Xanthomonadales bacterium]
MTATRAFSPHWEPRSPIGRGFDHVRDADAAVVLTHRGWSTLFGERTDVIGQSMTLNGRPHTIVGVLSRDFSFSSSEIAAHTLWIRAMGRSRKSASIRPVSSHV